MKRAEDFRKFESSLWSIAESLDMLPELPDGLGVDYLEKVASEFPVADNPYEPSDMRPGGLKVWDSVYLPMPKVISAETKRHRDIAVLRSTNGEWESTKEALCMSGRPDGVHYLRPKGQYILDMMNDDIRMLQGAHVIAHRIPGAPPRDEYTFGQRSDVFLRSLIKLFIARKYKLLVNVHPETQAEDSFSAYGIEVFGSSDLRAPLLMAAAGRSSRLMHDSTVVAVLGSVGIEPHPSQIGKSDVWKEINKWSCLPTLVALAGWECVDYIAHTERIALGGEPYYAVPCSDLQPMSGFDELLAAARESGREPKKGETVLTVDEWLGSDDFMRGLSVTPQLPCPDCIRINDKAAGVVKRPRSRKPRAKLKDARVSPAGDMKEWVDYVDFINSCLKIGRKATTHALKSVTAVTKRNSAYGKRTKISARIASLSARRDKKARNGFLAEAEAMTAEIERLRKELTNGS